MNSSCAKNANAMSVQSPDESSLYKNVYMAYYQILHNNRLLLFHQALINVLRNASPVYKEKYTSFSVFMVLLLLLL